MGERRITCFHIKVSAASKGAADTLIFFLRTSFAVCYVQVTDFPPAGKALQGTDVPRRFAGDGTEVCGAKELHQIDLRNMVDIVFPERLDVPLIAPVVN